MSSNKPSKRTVASSSPPTKSPPIYKTPSSRSQKTYFVSLQKRRLRTLLTFLAKAAFKKREEKTEMHFHFSIEGIFTVAVYFCKCFAFKNSHYTYSPLCSLLSLSFSL
ncbi:hypothetical protein L2E82_22323 [Cichorium intybus]|uniref:Uncharacterized protein n=1 Tax=Cichorium intybus TaxID=13427 RepID=A0ACB9DXJ8_CICIN|nr:hypothetical protein L2E82_22323 [Cichorium intybus]